MENKTFKLIVLRQQLAAYHGIHPAREPGDFQHSADILGLTPNNVGYDLCAAILHRLRREAVAVAGSDHAISVLHDPQTHARCGYTIHTYDQITADQIVATIQKLLP